MERTSSQVVRPASVEVAVLSVEEGNSQGARPALEEGELMFCEDINNSAY